jgi:hypothetical protein
MNIAQIMNDIQVQKIETHIFLFDYTKEWKIKLIYTSSAGDKLEVNRTNTDFEAALFAAYDALGLIRREGMNTLLPSPGEVYNAVETV